MTRFRSSLLALLFFSAIYLYAWPTPNVVYAGIDLIHVFLGILLAIVLLFTLLRIFKQATWIGRIAWSLLIVGAALGIALIFTGGRRTEWTLLYAHIIASLAGAALLASEWGAKQRWFAGSAQAAVARCAIFLLGAAV